MTGQRTSLQAGTTSQVASVHDPASQQTGVTQKLTGAPSALPQQFYRALRDLEQQSQALFSAHEFIERWEGEHGRGKMLRLGFGDLRRSSDPEFLAGMNQAVENPAAWIQPELKSRLDHPSIEPYPGHGNATIQTRAHVTLGYIIEDASEEEIDQLVKLVFLSQRSKKSFVPVFVTSSTYFTPFIRHGFIFEYLPPRETFEGRASLYDSYRSERLALITRKWGISRYLTRYGMPHVETAGDGAQTSERIVVFPDYAQGNPYIHIMYADMVDRYNISFGTIKDALAIVVQQPVTFHLHWEDAIYRTDRTPEIPLRMADFITDLDRFQAAGGTFIWTVHNLEPHDAADSELSREFMKQLITRADIIHAHSDWVRESIEAMVPGKQNIHVIAHPSYAGRYPGRQEQSHARANLNIGTDETLFLYFGNIRRYKGIENLLNVAPDFVHGAKFIIAGRSGRYDPRGAAPENCISIDRFIDDETVAELFSAADFAILPFEDVSTSGSLMLALTYGVPVIAPNHKGVEALIVDGRDGYLYDINTVGGLREAIERALATPSWTRQAMGKMVEATSIFYPPEAFSAAILKLYEDRAAYAEASRI